MNTKKQSTHIDHFSEIEKFVEQLLAKKNFPEVEPEVYEQLKADLRDRVEDHINGAILKHIPEDELDAFNQVLESGSDEAIQEFCKRHIPDMESVIREALVRFAGTYLGV